MGKSKSIRYVGGLLVKNTLLVSIALFSATIFTIAFSYVHSNEQSFLLGKPENLRSSSFYLTSLFLHGTTASIALLLSVFQISSQFRKKHLKIHVIFGKIYTWLVLLIAAPSGFIIAYYSDAKLPFYLLSVLWFFFTYKGFIAVNNKQLINHRNWMIRSFSLVIAAILLRLYILLGLKLFGTMTSEHYYIIAWLCWVPNLLVCELTIRLINNR